MFNERTSEITTKQDRKQTLKERQAQRIEEKIRAFLNRDLSYTQAGLYLEEVFVNPNNKNQFIAQFSTYDRRDNKDRRNQFTITKLAEDLKKEDIAAIVEKALNRCNSGLIEAYLPAFFAEGKLI